MMFKFFIEVESFFKKVFTLFHKGHAIYEKAENIKDEIKKGEVKINDIKNLVTNLKAEIKEKHPEQYAQLNNHNAPKVG